jgi:hypothetical protein
MRPAAPMPEKTTIAIQYTMARTIPAPMPYIARAFRW